MSSPVSPLPYAVEVAGAAVRYDVRGSGERTLVLVHGYQAQHMWWHAVVERLLSSWRVVLLDLSGHGDSAHRPEYSASTWADELLAVVEAVGGARPVLVGHSMGGRVALAAAALRSDMTAGVLMLDSAMRLGPGPTFPWDADREPRVFAQREDAIAHFHLKPDQPVAAELLAPVAENAVRALGSSWTWKHDQRGLPAISNQTTADALARITVPVHFVRAELSELTTDVTEALRLLDPEGRVTIHVALGCHHHLTIEAPQLVADVVDRLASEILQDLRLVHHP